MDLGSITEHDGRQCPGGGRAVDGASESLLNEVGQIAAVIDVGVTQNDRIQVPGPEGERAIALQTIRPVALE
jgi:hypothetical protein